LRGFADTCKVSLAGAAGTSQASQSAGQGAGWELVNLARQERGAGTGDGESGGKSNNGLHFDC